MSLFKQKQKDIIVRSTEVLVSAVGSDEKLAAMADCDAAIYNKHYADVTNTPVSDADSLVDVIKAGAFDLVHVLANVNADGTIGRTHADRVLRTCAKKNVRLVFFASNNPHGIYGTHIEPVPINLILTTDRNGDNFPNVLDGFLGKMSTGMALITAWSDLTPPRGSPPADFVVMPDCIFDFHECNVVLFGKEHTVAWNPQGHTLLTQGAGLMSGFSAIMYGDVPHGPIFYREEDRRVNIQWEWSASGNPNYDICIAGLDLREWDEPRGVKIDKEHQLKILRKLRQWLRDQNLKSDIDVPLEVEVTDRRCHWANCGERKAKGSAYCPRHRDLNMLRE